MQIYLIFFLEGHYFLDIQYVIYSYIHVLTQYNDTEYKLVLPFSFDEHLYKSYLFNVYAFRFEIWKFENFLIIKSVLFLLLNSNDFGSKEKEYFILNV